MGRLFWKFFLVFFLAQLTTTVGVGLALWLRRPPAVDVAQGAGLRASDFFLRGTLDGGPLYEGCDLVSPPDSKNGPCSLVAYSDSELLAEPRVDGVSMLALWTTTAANPGAWAVPNEYSEDGAEKVQDSIFPLVPLVASLLASLVFSAVLAVYFSRPIRRLRGAVDAAARGDLAVRPGADMGRRSDELADLARDFDRMASRLRGMVESQQRLLHDVSHELRSPLARQQAALDLARQQPSKLGISMNRIEVELYRLDALVGELLTLSRLEAGVNTEYVDEIDIGELLTEVVDDAAFELSSATRSIVMHLGVQVHVYGQYELLRRAIENVVRNAIKHTADGTQVTVLVTITRHRLRILVSDRGPGVTPEDLDAIFQPFFRSGDSGAVSGHGLGLAIARRVIEAHRGTVQAMNRPGGGLSIEISLPIADDTLEPLHHTSHGSEQVRRR